MNSVTIAAILHKLRAIRLLSIVLVVCGLLFTSNYGHATKAKPEDDSAKNSVKPQTLQTFKPLLVEKWGIELIAIRLSAADHMVDFRYRVLDKEKAAPLHKRQTKPHLIHKSSGKVLAVPNTAKVGALRNSNMPQEGRIYWMFFGTSGLVKKGDKVSIVIGDFWADDLVIE